MLGHVYEYFVLRFASAEGKGGGEFYTPNSVVRLLVQMIETYHGRVYDPCCGSSGTIVQSAEFVNAHATGNGNGGKAKSDISIYGQESNHTTWRIAKMNLAIRGIEGQIAHGNSFHNDRHPDLKAAFILPNPPFNISDWGGERLRDDQLFIDARKLGRMTHRTHRELTEDNIARISSTYHAWRDSSDDYEDIPGFSEAATLEEVAKHDFVLTPGRYVGAEPQPDDDEPFE